MSRILLWLTRTFLGSPQSFLGIWGYFWCIFAMYLIYGYSMIGIIFLIPDSFVGIKGWYQQQVRKTGEYSLLMLQTKAGREKEFHAVSSQDVPTC